MSNNAANPHETDWLPEGLEPVALRLARADALIEEIAELSFGWSFDHPLEIHQIERAPGVFDLEVVSVRPIPPIITILFSEVIHHLRCVLDNTVFYLVTAERGTDLTESEATAVEMPIFETSEKFDEWQRKKRNKLPEVAAGSELGKLIRLLQPFADPSKVPSISGVLAEMMKTTSHKEHPLRLLQRYSNLDKHRFVRMAVAQTLFEREDEPFATREHKMVPIDVGTVLGSVEVGKPVNATLSPTVMLERPDSSVVIAPAMELAQIHSFVQDDVVPILVKGIAISGALPEQIDLSDNGKTLRERIREGVKGSATERLYEKSLERYVQGMQRDAKVPTIIRLPSND